MTRILTVKEVETIAAHAHLEPEAELCASHEALRAERDRALAVLEAAREIAPLRRYSAARWERLEHAIAAYDARKR